MANLLWGYAHLRYFHLPLLCAIEDYTHRHLVDLPPTQLARLILSFAILNHRPSDALLEELAYFLALNLDKMEPMPAVQASWGIGVLGALNEPLYLKFGNCAEAMQITDLGVAEQKMLIDLEMMANIVAKQTAAEPFTLPSHLRAEALETSQDSITYTSALLTSLERQIMGALISMGLTYEPMVITANGCLRVDIMLDHRSNRVAVEVLERQRYSANAPYHPVGSVILRQRLLEAEGWKVLQISTHDWEILKSERAREAYLRRRLDSLLQLEPEQQPQGGACHSSPTVAEQQQQRKCYAEADWWFW
mmetsp:Transcript_4801/g.13357  ORF Transcript_4801/g.13357 Transcript_4801/m.13357 type:complete len:306 (-) Transcript_4801:497-1414(-)